MTWIIFFVAVLAVFSKPRRVRLDGHEKEIGGWNG